MADGNKKALVSSQKIKNPKAKKANFKRKIPKPQTSVTKAVLLVAFTAEIRHSCTKQMK